MPRVAVAQIKVIDNVEKNSQQILKFIDKAFNKQADIVCFPETCLNPDNENVLDVSGHIKEIRERCREKSIYCIFGSYIKSGKKYLIQSS